MQKFTNGIFNIKLSLILISGILYIFITDAKSANIIPWKISKEDISLAKNAQYWAKRNNWSNSIAHSAKAKDPLIKEIYLWKKYVTGSKNIKFDNISKFIAKHKDWPEIDDMLLNAEKSLNDQTSPQKIVDWFWKEEDKKFEMPKTFEGKTRLLEAIEAINSNSLERKKDIEKLIKSIWINEILTKKDEWKFLSKYKSYLTVQDYIERIDNLIWKNQIQSAKRIIDVVDEDHKKLFDVRIKLRKNSYGIDEAIRNLPKKFKYESGFLYDRIKWRHDRKRTDSVIELIVYAPKDPEHNSEWWRIKKKYISKLVDSKQYRKAYNLAKNHGFNPSGENSNIYKFAKAEWISGWIAYKFLKNYNDAYKHFSLLYKNVKSPISLGRASYWSGKASEKLNKKDIAQKWYSISSEYKTSFYGQIANDKINNDKLELHDKIIPSLADKNHFSNNLLMKAAYILYKSKSPSSALKFAKVAVTKAKTKGEQILIAKLAMSLNRKDHGIIIAKTATRQTGNTLTEANYPILDYVNSKNINLPPPLAHAIIMQESVFNVGIKSHAGALGLMQLMPATAKETAKKMKVQYRKARLYTDGKYNIKLGSYYLEKQIQRFNGSYILAIAAYNGGAGNVNKWIRKLGDPRRLKTADEVIEWIETIPFYETRNYVQRVIENLQIYRYIIDKRHNAKINTINDILR